MRNIQFSYLYRDGGNYKQHGSIVLENASNTTLKVVEKCVKSNLIDGCWFYAKDWQLPDLRFADINETDPTWHEFESVEYTDSPPNSTLSLEEFMLLIEKSAQSIV